MINSMTAFSRKMIEGDFGTLIWEMRSVNHRFLEVNLRLPETFKPLEKNIRDAIQKKMKRGKVDAVLKYMPGEQTSYDFSVNEGMISKLKNLHEQVVQQFEPQPVPVNFTDLLSWQGVVHVKESNVEEVCQSALTLLGAVLEDMLATRQREGEKIKSFMLARLTDMQAQQVVVEKKVPEIRAVQRERLESKVAELTADVNQDRLEQEVVWWAQKSDVAEELQRLNTHIDEVSRILNKGGVVGRRLDFLMQELNREANTLSSKAAAIEVTQAAVELKVLIEQLREQVQNVE